MDFLSGHGLNEKGGKIMEKKQSRKSAWILAALMLGAFTLALQLGAVGALAQDADSDGLSDTLETNPNGFLLINGMTLEATEDAAVPNCIASELPRDRCVDPGKQDLFVIIKRATNPCPNPTSCGDPCGPPLFNNATTDIAPYSEYPSIYGTTSGPLQWVSGIATGFATHPLLQNPPFASQVIEAGGRYAVKIIEDLNPCSSYMGLSTPGTPTATSSATVWPEKIMNWIDKACSQACFVDRNNVQTCYSPATTSGFFCKNYNNPNLAPVDMKAPNPDLRPLYHDFIKNVISHEVSHMMHLAYGSGTSADHHWPIAYGYLMEQSIQTKATKDKSGKITVTLYISTGYTNQDKTQHALK
jgi:hypothetical protein